MIPKEVLFDDKLNTQHRRVFATLYTQWQTQGDKWIGYGMVGLQTGGLSIEYVMQLMHELKEHGHIIEPWAEYFKKNV